MTPTIEPSDVPLDTILETIADERRRLIIRHLRNAADEVATCEEVADYVHTNSSDERDSEKTKIRLHHVSLPMLDSAGLIEYDSGKNTVRYHPQQEVDALLEYIDTIDEK